MISRKGKHLNKIAKISVLDFTIYTKVQITAETFLPPGVKKLTLGTITWSARKWLVRMLASVGEFAGNAVSRNSI